MNMTKKELMNTIQTCDFAMLDTGLYLDTHPDDRKALDYYDKMRTTRNEAVAEYNRLYGPLTADTTDVTTTWTWTDGPWPWEKEDNHVDL